MKTKPSSVLLVVLVDFRQDRNLSHLDMAKHLGMTQNGYRRVENGEVRLTVDTLYSISEALAISLRDIAVSLESAIALMRSNGWEVGCDVTTDDLKDRGLRGTDIYRKPAAPKA